MRRAAEDGARAVVHQDEVGDPDRQGPIVVERVNDLQPRVVAELFTRLELDLRNPALATGLDEFGGLRIDR